MTPNVKTKEDVLDKLFKPWNPDLYYTSLHMSAIIFINNIKTILRL